MFEHNSVSYKIISHWSKYVLCLLVLLSILDFRMAQKSDSSYCERVDSKMPFQYSPTTYGK